MTFRRKLWRWLTAPGWVEGFSGFPDYTPAEDAHGRYVNGKHRTLRWWLRDVWLAATGRTYCTLVVCQGEREWAVECYSDLHFPVISKGGISAHLVQFNGSMYSPRVRERQEQSAPTSAG
jgi:hypothetical protein